MFAGASLDENSGAFCELKANFFRLILTKAELGGMKWSDIDFKKKVVHVRRSLSCSYYNGEKRMSEKEGVLAVQENREPREIRDFHPHSLRHTFATRCFEKKMEPKVVQRLMGHSSISITLNIYTHVLDNIMEEEIKKFGVVKTQTPEEYYNEEIRRARISAMSHC